MQDLARQIIEANSGLTTSRRRSNLIDNHRTLEALLASGRIELNPSPFLTTDPPPLGPDFDFDRVEGMLLGLAVGDALGNTTEALLPHERRRRHGEIAHYLPNPHASGRAVGLPSDDTQLAFWSLEQLNADGGLVPERLSRRLSCQRIFGIGHSVKEFVRRFNDDGLPWQEAGVPSAGNGALMRQQHPSSSLTSPGPRPTCGPTPPSPQC